VPPRCRALTGFTTRPTVARLKTDAADQLREQRGHHFKAVRSAVHLTHFTEVSIMSNSTSIQSALAQLQAAMAKSDAHLAKIKERAAQVAQKAEAAVEAAKPVVAEAATTAGYIAKDFAVLAWDVATSDEAKAFYVRTGKAITHAAAYLVTIAIWGAILACGWCRDELPRLAQDARSAFRAAVASAQPEPKALPWSAETGFSRYFLAQAAEELEIVWPEPNPNARWVTGMLPMA